jgi:hypothetical protein
MCHFLPENLFFLKTICIQKVGVFSIKIKKALKKEIE